MDKIKNPMDLQTIKENILKKKYHCREDFLHDIQQIHINSSIFNGDDDVFTLKAMTLLQVRFNPGASTKRELSTVVIISQRAVTTYSVGHNSATSYYKGM